MSFQFPWRSTGQITREVDEELAYHLEARVAQLVAAGQAPEAARRQAAEEFGDLDATRRYCRDTDLARERERRRRDHLGDLLLDIRYALRSLRRRPGVTAVVIGSLALGVGANTAIFSVVNAVLLRPLPYPDPGHLIHIVERDARTPRMNLTDPNFRDLEVQSRLVAALGAYRVGQAQVAHAGRGTVVQTGIVSPGFFRAMGVEPMAGRTFSSEETAEGGRPAVVVSHQFWQAVMGGGADAVGTTVMADGRAHTVVGVMPPGFAFPAGAEFWVPDQVYSLRGSSRSSHNLRVVGRLAPGATLAGVAAEFAAIGAGLAAEYPSELDAGFHFVAFPLGEELGRASRDSLVLLLVVVSLVMLIGCANLAFVLLAQATARGRELAIRQAVGGGAARLVRQLLTETTVLGLLGGLGGLVLTVASLRVLNRMVPAGVLHSGPVTLDWRVAGFGLALGILAGFTFGLAPVWRATRLSPLEAMKADGPVLTGGSRQRPFGGGLLVFQYGLSFAALVLAVVMTRSLLRLEATAGGFATEGRVSAQLLIPVREGTRYPDHRSAMDLLDRYGERLRQSPGVVSVAFDRTPPLAGTSFNQRILLEAGNVLGNDWPDIRTVTPGYFGTLGIPLRHGRDFVRGDSAGSEPVAIINQLLAERLWPGQEAVGRRFKRWEDDPWITVIGVVGEVRTRLDHDPPLGIYLPMFQDPFRTTAMSVVVQGQGGIESLARTVREALRAEDRELALRQVRSLEAIRSESIALPRFRTRLVLGFGLVALLLVVLGVYGVQGYAVSLRRQEMAIRSALGAQRRHLTGLFVVQGVRVALIGTILGVLLALGLSRLLATLIVGVQALDPGVMAVVMVVMVGSVLAACLLPARRAADTDPSEAMRGGAFH